jgi:hypothetical protein
MRLAACTPAVILHSFLSFGCRQLRQSDVSLLPIFCRRYSQATFIHRTFYGIYMGTYEVAREALRAAGLPGAFGSIRLQ